MSICGWVKTVMQVKRENTKLLNTPKRVRINTQQALTSQHGEEGKGEGRGGDGARGKWRVRGRREKEKW